MSLAVIPIFDLSGSVILAIWLRVIFSTLSVESPVTPGTPEISKFMRQLYCSRSSSSALTSDNEHLSVSLTSLRDAISWPSLAVSFSTIALNCTFRSSTNLAFNFVSQNVAYLLQV